MVLLGEILDFVYQELSLDQPVFHYQILTYQNFYRFVMESVDDEENAYDHDEESEIAYDEETFPFLENDVEEENGGEEEILDAVGISDVEKIYVADVMGSCGDA